MPRNKDMAKINQDKPINVRGDGWRSAVFPLNINKKIQGNPIVPTGEKAKSVVKFTIFGQHSALVDVNGNQIENGFPMTDDDDKCMARVDYTNPAKYYIKVNSQGHPYNPIGMYEEGTLNKDLKFKKQWQFREVNKKVFNFYLNFLKTKNKAWINNCSRELV